MTDAVSPFPAGADSGPVVLLPNGSFRTPRLGERQDTGRKLTVKYNGTGATAGKARVDLLFYVAMKG